jgi:septal ring factor EnvC (AmiA/AmiB activator)
MNAGTAVSGTITATKGDGSTFDVHFTGVSVNPSWDAETRVLTLPVVNADGTTTNVTANIGKDIFLDPGEGKNYFDPDTKEIVLTLNDDPDNPTVIRIPASALYNDYTGAATNSGTVAIDATSHAISFDLNINAATNNALVLDANGLMVDLSAYATTEALENVRSSLQGQIDSTTATLAATTAALGTLESNYNATTAELATLEGNYNATTAELATLEGNYNATTAELAELEGNYNNTTAALDTLTSNYNATTAELAELEGNYNATTAALDTLTTNYNATTVQVAQNTEDIAALALAATTWAGFTD